MQLFIDSGYLSNPEKLIKEKLITYLRSNPKLIDEWILWSGDQRIPEGWYFEKKENKFIIGYYPSEVKFVYLDPFIACAEFIEKEVEQWKSQARK